MEMSEKPEGTGPKPEEPSLRDVVRAIDGLTLRMDVSRPEVRINSGLANRQAGNPHKH